MVLIPVLCPHCHSDQVIKGGKTKTGQQRYKCENPDCPHYSFQLSALNQVPEPQSLVLLATGIVGLLGYGWRKRSRDL